jgi:hypothetical protein
MALSLGFGVLFATFIILLLVPALYMIVHDLGTRGLKAWRFVYGPIDQPVGGE